MPYTVIVRFSVSQGQRYSPLPKGEDWRDGSST